MGPRRSTGSLRTLVLIDGEHYPAVVARAIARLGAEYEVAGALLVGGTEKLGQVAHEVGVPLHAADQDPEKALAALLSKGSYDVVYDLSDEPVLGYEARCRMASIALWSGTEYRGSDFTFTPPHRPALTSVPSVAIIATGKRTGKTAIAGALARHLSEQGHSPVVVAMGRGGPEEPEVIGPGAALDPARLLQVAEAGRHASSDHFEDALTSGVATVGSWRAGGGMAGAVSSGNYEEAVRVAEGLGPTIMIFEGSGAAIPPVEAGATLLAVDSRMEPHLLRGYLGLYRVLLSDLVVLTMCEEPIDRARIAALESCIRSGPSNPPRVLRTIFRPHPLGEVHGKKIWLVTTAGTQGADAMARHLAQSHSAQVVAMSGNLADRASLRSELGSFPDADAIVVELKAAAVDVVTKFGRDRGMEVIYMDNRPIALGPDELGPVFSEFAATAMERSR